MHLQSAKEKFPDEKNVLIQTPCYEAYSCPRKDNSVIIRILGDHVTDAVAGKYPEKSCFSKDVLDDGTVDYWEEADEHASKDWKGKLGASVTDVLIKPQLKERGDEWPRGLGHSILFDFPAGYKLFAHRKGDRHTPRTDYYLRGSKTQSQFRSPAEFAFHLMWLLDGQLTTPNGCKCTYCSHRPQSEIAKELGPGMKQENRRGRGTSRTRHAQQSIPRVEIQAKDYTKLHR